MALQGCPLGHPSIQPHHSVACRSDAYLPLGGALRELRLTDCHLLAAPDVLATLTSLTLLSIGMCANFAESQGELCAGADSARLDALTAAL